MILPYSFLSSPICSPRLSVPEPKTVLRTGGIFARGGLMKRGEGLNGLLLVGE